MKLSEFYEKYWVVNGVKPPPLSKAEKDFLDEHADGPPRLTAWFNRKRKGLLTIDIDLLKEEMKKLPDFLTGTTPSSESNGLSNSEK